jgi:hypothetical protein
VRTVSIENRDITDRSIDVASNVADVVLTLSDRWSEVRGRVTGGSGPDETASVLVFPGGGFPFTEVAWTGSRRFQSTRADRDGSYSIRNLPPGDYYLAAIPDEEAGNWIDAEFLSALTRSATSVHISEGETKTQDLRTLAVRR